MYFYIGGALVKMLVNVMLNVMFLFAIYGLQISQNDDIIGYWLFSIELFIQQVFRTLNFINAELYEVNNFK